MRTNGSCVLSADGKSENCQYKNVLFQSTVSIALDKSKLPIMGNTEDVPNGTWTSYSTNANNFTPAQRVNNYVSWYLNGVVGQAEQDLSNINPDNLVNFSGPINKLLPQEVQFVQRIATVTNAFNTQHEDLTVSAVDKNARHNQQLI